MTKRVLVKLVGVACLFSFSAVHGIEAHGPTLAVDKTVVSAGDTLTITGEGLSGGGQVELTLQGVLQDYRLPAVARTDEHGRFEQAVMVPATVAPGAYTLIAKGTQTATAKIEVTAAVAAAGDPDAAKAAEHADVAHDHASVEAGHEHPAEAAALASAEPMDVDRPAGGAARAVGWGSVVLAAMAGFVLLRGNRRVV